MRCPLIAAQGVETRSCRNLGQLANTSLPGWTGSIEPTMSDIVLPLWQLSARGKTVVIPQPGTANLPPSRNSTQWSRGEKPSGILYEFCARRAIRTRDVPHAVMPPKTTDEAVVVMRSAFVELWKDPQFLRDYSNIVKTDPILVSARKAGRSWPPWQDQAADQGFHHRLLESTGK